MHENLSVRGRIGIVLELIRLTAAEDLSWEPNGDPSSFASRRGRATATIERIESPEHLRLRFDVLDSTAAEVVIEFPGPNHGEPGDLQSLHKALEKLWQMTEKRAVPNAADLFLRGDT